MARHRRCIETFAFLVLAAVGSSASAGGEPTPSEGATARVAGARPDLVAKRAYVAEYRWPIGAGPLTPVTEPLAQGKKVLLACDVENAGAKLSRRWQLAYRIDGRQASTQTVAVMQRGEVRTFAAPYLPNAEGTRALACVVDAKKAIRERREQNNVARTTFVVAPLSLELSVRLRPQETGMWCWAASGQMAMEYLGKNVAQCEEANTRFGRSDCCTIQLCPNPVAGHPCVTGGWPQFERFGFTSRHTSSVALTFEQLRSEFSAGRPVAFSWGWEGGGGHMMLAHGARLANGVEQVLVLDPWSPCVGDSNLITYEEYVDRPGDHVHWDDYHEIQRVPSGETEAIAAFAGRPRVETTSGPAEDAPGAAAGEPKPGADPVRRAPGAPRTHPTAKAAAAAALRDIAAPAAPGGAWSGPGAGNVMGFTGPGDAARASVGEPIREAIVRLDELQQYEPGTDASALLHETGSFLVPVVVGGEVRSGVTVTKREGGYGTVALGNRSIARSAAGQLASGPGGSAAKEAMIVRVPALRVAFLARGKGAQLVFVPLADDARFDFKAGTPVPAASALERLLPAARTQRSNEPG